MDYDRNSFAKNIDGLVTLYDVRSTYNKHKNLIHSDEGLKYKFKKRINGLVRKQDNVTGDVIPVSHCPLMIAAVDEILEYLEEDLPAPTVKVQAREQETVEEPIKKKRPSLFQQDSNNLEEFFHNRAESGNLLEEVNLEVIKKALEKHDFNLTQASKYLGITQRTLRTKIQEIKNREAL